MTGSSADPGPGDPPDGARQPTTWDLVKRRGGGAAYQAHFDRLAHAGEHVHGEADFVADLVDAPARILDAGCGTGRVAAELSARGYRVTGVDIDADMLAEARRRDHLSTYVEQDLSRLALRQQQVDLTLLAGNVIPLLAPGTVFEVTKRLTAHTRPGGLLVAGFGLDADHLPGDFVVANLGEYDAATRTAGLTLVSRFASWDRDPWLDSGGYAVSVHRVA